MEKQSLFDNCTEWNNKSLNNVKACLEEIDRNKPLIETYGLLEDIIKHLKNLIDMTELTYNDFDEEELNEESNSETFEKGLDLGKKIIINNLKQLLTEKFNIDLSKIDDLKEDDDCPPCIAAARERERLQKLQAEGLNNEISGMNDILNTLENIDDVNQENLNEETELYDLS